MPGYAPRKAALGGVGKMNVELRNLSTVSTALTLSLDDQDAYLVWGGQSSASRITLPYPEAGLFYQIFLNGPGVSTATKFLSTANNLDGLSVDIITGGSTAKGAALASTVEAGASVQFLGLDSRRWLALRGPGSTVALGTATS